MMEAQLAHKSAGKLLAELKRLRALRAVQDGYLGIQSDSQLASNLEGEFRVGPPAHRDCVAIRESALMSC